MPTNSRARRPAIHIAQEDLESRVFLRLGEVYPHRKALSHLQTGSDIYTGQATEKSTKVEEFQNGALLFSK